MSEKLESKKSERKYKLTSFRTSALLYAVYLQVLGFILIYDLFYFKIKVPKRLVIEIPEISATIVCKKKGFNYSPYIQNARFGLFMFAAIIFNQIFSAVGNRINGVSKLLDLLIYNGKWLISVAILVSTMLYFLFNGYAFIFLHLASLVGIYIIMFKSSRTYWSKALRIMGIIWFQFLSFGNVFATEGLSLFSITNRMDHLRKRFFSFLTKQSFPIDKIMFFKYDEGMIGYIENYLTQPEIWMSSVFLSEENFEAFKVVFLGLLAHMKIGNIKYRHLAMTPFTIIQLGYFTKYLSGCSDEDDVGAYSNGCLGLFAITNLSKFVWNVLVQPHHFAADNYVVTNEPDLRYSMVVSLLMSISEGVTIPGKNLSDENKTRINILAKSFIRPPYHPLYEMPSSYERILGLLPALVIDKKDYEQPTSPIIEEAE